MIVVKKEQFVDHSCGERCAKDSRRNGWDPTEDSGLRVSVSSGGSKKVCSPF